MKHILSSILSGSFINIIRTLKPGLLLISYYMSPLKKIVGHFNSALFFFFTSILLLLPSSNCEFCKGIPAVNNPLSIHLAAFLSYKAAFSLQFFFTAGFLSWCTEVKSSWTISRMSRSLMKFSSEFHGRWFLKVCVSSGLSRSYTLSLAPRNFFQAPCHCFLFFEWNLHLALEFVNGECDMPISQANSWFCMGFHLIDHRFVAEVLTSYLFFLVLSYWNQWSTWETGIPNMHFLSLLLN